MVLPADISKQHNSVFLLDRDLRIREINNGYREFDEGNGGGADFAAHFGPGCLVMQVIPSRLQAFYSAFYARALEGEKIEHCYDCHAPDSFRRFILRLIPADGG